MRLSRSQGRTFRSTDASPFTIAGGSDLAEFSIVRTVGAMNPWKIVNIALTGELTSADTGIGVRAGQQVVLTPANAGLTSLAHGAVVGIYEGNGGSGAANLAQTTTSATNPTITLAQLSSAIPVTGFEQKAAITGDVIEICTRGPTWVHAWDNTTDNSGDISIGDVIGVPHGTAGTAGVAVRIGAHSTLHLVGRIVALEAQTQILTTGISQLTRCLIHT